MEKMHIVIILMVVTLVISLANVAITLNLKDDLASGDVKTVKSNVAVKASGPIDDDQVKGSPSAKVTIVEFSDFQCPYCKRFHVESFPTIEEKYITTGKANFVYRDFPLGGHQYAQKASEAAECANSQGKYWEYHNILFTNQQTLDVASLKSYASTLGLDTAKFNSCLDNGEMVAEVKADYDAGVALGISGTPAFVINGKVMTGACPSQSFSDAI